jgi:hypothetical protein
MKISMLPVFAASENDTWHFASGQFVHQSARDRDLPVSGAQVPPQGPGPMHLILLMLHAGPNKSWIMTVQVRRGTQAIYHIRLLFAPWFSVCPTTASLPIPFSAPSRTELRWDGMGWGLVESGKKFSETGK